MRKTISILLTFIFFAVSCALPNNNINSQTKDNLKSEIKGKAYFYKDSKTKDYIKPLMTFKTSDEECQGGVLTSMAVLSGIPSNCNDKLDFYIKGQLANTIIAEQAGNYSTSFCLDCGVYDFEIRTTIIDNGSGLCNSSLKNQTFILPGGYHTEHIPCDRPEEDEEPECEGESSIIEPSALKSTFNIKAYSSSDIQSSVEEYLSKVDEVNMLQSQYDNLDNRGLNSKRNEIYTKLQNSITQRNSIKTELITGLNNYKNSLRSKVNSLMNDPEFSVDDNYQPTDLQDYKDLILKHEVNLFGLPDLDNTYYITILIHNISSEINLMISAIEDYSIGSISNLTNYTETLYFQELNQVTKIENLILYLAKQIGNHKVKIDSNIQKLSEKIKNLNLIIESEKNILDTKLSELNFLDGDISNEIDSIESEYNNLPENTPDIPESEYLLEHQKIDNLVNELNEIYIDYDEYKSIHEQVSAFKIKSLKLKLLNGAINLLKDAAKKGINVISRLKPKKDAIKDKVKEAKKPADKIKNANNNINNSVKPPISCNVNSSLSRMEQFTELFRTGITNSRGEHFGINPHVINSLRKSGRRKITPDDMTQALNNNPVPGITTPSGPSVIYKNTNTGTEFFVNPLTNQIVGVKPSNFK